MARDIWIILFAFGFILFNWPVLSMFGHGLSVYLFTAWMIFIVLVYVAAEVGKKSDNGG